MGKINEITTPFMKYILFSLFLFPLYLLSQTFPVLEFQKFYENPNGDDYVRRMVKTADGNLVLGGHSVYQAGGCTDLRLIKIDTAGRVIWEKKLPLEGCQELNDMVATPDSSVVFVGSSSAMLEHYEDADNLYRSDFWVGKINKNGEFTWLKSMGGEGTDIGYSIAQLGADFVLTGGSFSKEGEVMENHGASDVWCLRVNSMGKPKFSTVIGGKGHEWAKTIAVCKNGDLILAGFTNSDKLTGNISRIPTSRNGNALLIRMKENGQMLWLRTYPTPHGGIFNQIQEDQQGRIIVAGTYHVQAYDSQFWLMKLTADGKTILDQKIGNLDNESLTCLAICHDTSYLFGGYSQSVRNGGDSLSKGKDDFHLFKMDKFGNIIWRKVYGGGDRERCYSVLEYAKGVLFAVGEKENYYTGDKKGDTDLWLLKITDHECDSLPLNMFIRSNENNEVEVNQPVRLRAQHQHGQRFLWDFGDGTFAKEEQPLKTFTQKGEFEINLTVYYSEACATSFTLPQKVIVK
ncbi:MAG: PKD domain-containing protein [Bacteroidia bacterium]